MPPQVDLENAIRRTKAQPPVERERSLARMHPRIVEPAVGCGAEDSGHERRTDAPVAMVGEDVHALDVPGETEPGPWPGHAVDERKPRHAYRGVPDACEEREVRVLVVAEPLNEACVELVAGQTLLSLFMDAPRPAERSQIPAIGEDRRSDGRLTGPHDRNLTPA